MNTSPVYALTSLVKEGTTPSPSPQLPTTTFNTAVLAAVLGAATIGTGGVANLQVLNLPTFTSPVACACSVHVRQDEEERLLDTQEKIAGIRRYLSLNITDLAKVLNVGRPTVYSWATTPVNLHSNHRKQIDTVYEIARTWRALYSDPMGRLVREPLENGRTMIDLISEDKLDSEAVSKAMLQVRQLQSRMQRRLTVAEAAEKAGVQLASRPRRNWRSSGDLEV
jgi:hypothetical protein